MTEIDRETIHFATQEKRYSIIQLLAERKGSVPAGDIRDNIDGANATVNEHVAKLESRGLVKRKELDKGERDRDKPYVFYLLTVDGLTIYTAVSELA